MEYSRSGNPNRKCVEDFMGDLFQGQSVCMVSREMALYSVIHTSNTSKLLFNPNSRIHRELNEKIEAFGRLLNFTQGEYTTQEKNIEENSVAVFSLEEWGTMHKKFVSKKLTIAVEMTVGDVMRDRSLRYFLQNHFKVKYLIVKVNKIFRDRPVNETFVVTRTNEEKNPIKTVLNSMGANPCVFNCFEMLNNFKMLNLMPYRKARTKVDQNLTVGPKNNAKH